MRVEQLKELLQSLVKLPNESEWVEFKQNFHSPDEIGERLSALANGACLHNEPSGYLVFGVENETHRITGTSFQPHKQKAKGNEDLESWLINRLSPKADFRIYTLDIDDGKNVVIFIIPAAQNRPIEFLHKPYIRVGSYTKNLQEYPDKQAKIWQKGAPDWSAEVCTGATISDLLPQAIARAKELYSGKHPHLADEMSSWDNIKFLNKSKLCIASQVTI